MCGLFLYLSAHVDEARGFLSRPANGVTTVYLLQKAAFNMDAVMSGLSEVYHAND